MDIDKLIEGLQRETIFIPSKETVRRLIEQGEVMAFPAKQSIIASGEVDSNVYLVVDGTIRVGWYDGNKEITYGFGGPCTFILSPKGFFDNKEAFFFIEAGEDCTLLMWSKAMIAKLLAESHELSQWMFYLAMGQFFSTEMKASILQGNAKDRFERVVNNKDLEKLILLSKRPDLLQTFSSKVLASYLGVSPSYLSNLRKAYFMRQSAKTAKAKGDGRKNNSPMVQPKASANGADDVVNGANYDEATTKVQMLKIIKKNPAITAQVISQVTGMSLRTVKYYFKALREDGKIRRVGNNRTGYWEVL